MQSAAKVLFVDDEVRVVNLLKMIFRATHEVFTATSGQQALEIIAANDIQVVVSDQRMPGMLGVELLAAVRQRSPDTMRILLTGYSDLAAIVGSVNDGEVFRFINKPWDQQEIKTIIGEAAEIALATRAAAPAPIATVLTPQTLAQASEVLVIDDNDADRRLTMKLFESEYRVHGAASLPEALRLLEHHDTGVIVSEAQVGGDDTSQLLRVLKKHYPLITTVMLTNLADSAHVIQLINRAQIFRFAMKPIRSGAFLQLAVGAAMKEHQRFRTNPEMVARHRVSKSLEPENSSLVASVTASLSKLRARLSFFASHAGTS